VAAEEYKVANIALARDKRPKIENPAYFAEAGCVIKVPG
jgi:hypothetical protein